MFFAVLTVAIVACHGYLWKRLIGDTTAPRTAVRRTATAVLVLLVTLMAAAVTLGTAVPPEVGRWFAWPGYLWLAMFFYLLLGLLALEPARWALRRWTTTGPRGRGRRGTPAPKETSGADSGGAATDGAATEGAATEGTDTDGAATVSGGAPTNTAPQRPGVDRRVVLARGSAALVGTVATGLVGYGVTVATGAPALARIPVTVGRLDPRADGFRIALVSDLHLGPIIGRSYTRRIVDLVNAERVDAVALVGDLVDGDVRDLAEAAAPLADLRSGHGTFYVTGNHEYYVGYRQWVEHLPTLGIRPLRNERVPIETGGGVFDLAGINDHTGYRWQDPGDVGAALAGRDPGRAVVLLAHQPVDVTDAVDAGVDLMLAGHTHGGQLTPFEVAVSLQQGAVAGLYRRGDTRLYVTSGAGFWGPPVRVGAPPEISIVELRAP